MVGIGENAFAPNATVTRAMVAQILYNLEGQPVTTGSDRFDDVSKDAWYCDAVKWATEVGIVQGTGDGLYAPLSEITREQLAVVLYNYAGYKGYRTDKLVSLGRFDDAGTLSDWATTAMQWAVNEKLFIGKDLQTLDPKGSATRGQTAKVLTFFRESFEL